LRPQHGDDLIFRVAANSLDAYLDFDPKRKGDLAKLHKLMRKQRQAGNGSLSEWLAQRVGPPGLSLPATSVSARRSSTQQRYWLRLISVGSRRSDVERPVEIRDIAEAAIEGDVETDHVRCKDRQHAIGAGESLFENERRKKSRLPAQTACANSEV